MKARIRSAIVAVLRPLGRGLFWTTVGLGTTATIVFSPTSWPRLRRAPVELLNVNSINDWTILFVLILGPLAWIIAGAALREEK